MGRLFLGQSLDLYRDDITTKSGMIQTTTTANIIYHPYLLCGCMYWCFFQHVFFHLPATTTKRVCQTLGTVFPIARHNRSHPNCHTFGVPMYIPFFGHALSRETAFFDASQPFLDIPDGFWFLSVFIPPWYSDDLPGCRCLSSLSTGYLTGGWARVGGKGSLSSWIAIICNSSDSVIMNQPRLLIVKSHVEPCYSNYNANAIPWIKFQMEHTLYISLYHHVCWLQSNKHQALEFTMTQHKGIT